MAQAQIEKLINSFGLNEKQRQAALERDRDVVVTAGAGSGKTLTLVARYTALLAEGIPPRRIAAITFSIKAAREMRSRVRAKLIALQQTAENQEQRQKWVELSARIDAARISTIHSLCAEILRAHPAEAGIDPRFDVLDEGLSAALRDQAVEDTLKLLAEDDAFSPLLYNISTYHLSKLLADLLDDRLEAAEVLQRTVGQGALIAKELRERMAHPVIKDLIQDLQGMPEDDLINDGGDKLADMVLDLLGHWQQAAQALEDGELIRCAQTLYMIRRSKMRGNVGKRDSLVKAKLAELRDYFDALINPLTGGQNSQDPIPSAKSEILSQDLQALIREAFDVVCQTYQDALDSRQALDFDDLEGRALQLLQRDDIQHHWQSELDAVLVDEFQDTNQRQRGIVEALTDMPGELFIVGDMRQSIYRFRQADVTVFSEVQERILDEGGLLVDLDLTYRAHQPLLDGMGVLLSGAIGTQPDPARPYYVPYTPMTASKPSPPEGLLPPHVEFVFGSGENAADSQTLTARALAKRLIELQAEGQITQWDEVALLFRATTGFSVYEEALQEAGVPFVTVAGRGFYDRPEIRDLLNILRALADPQDDLAFAGLLRSPAFGLSDAALYLLRQTRLPYQEAISADLSFLDENDRYYAHRADRLVKRLLPLVNRIPVAELIKQVVDALDYRALLATADQVQAGQEAAAAGGRLYRNLDKLLEDALASQQVSVHNYLDMIKTLNDAGAREGEAPSEAQGAVRLMTIHKAKGLEFEVVVLAAASRGVRSYSEMAYLDQDLGFTLKLDPPTMLYNLAEHMDKDQEAMEELRVLYVALTRAREKLIVSGYTCPNKDGDPSFRNWSGKLVEAADLQAYDFHKADGEPFEHPMGGFPLRVWCAEGEVTFPVRELDQIETEQTALDARRPLYRPILEETAQPQPEEERDPLMDPSAWRAAEQDSLSLAQVLGRLVHKALQRGMFPGDPRLESFLEAHAIDAGLVTTAQRKDALDKAVTLLDRLKKHPLWDRVSTASKRYHELPFTYQVTGRAKNGKIDVLYQDQAGWHIVDFKTDKIDSSAYRAELAAKYAPQVRHYQHAVRALLDIEADTSICFLDDRGGIRLVEVQTFT